MEEFIKKVYDRVINIILHDIPKNYQDEVSKNYLEYLSKKYSNKYNDENIDIDFIISIENSTWSIVPFGYKLQLFVKDDSLEKIREISLEAYNLAKERLEKKLESTIRSEEIDNKIKMFDELLMNVKDFNKDLAKALVSEGVADFVYASGKTDVTSLRIGHINKSK